MLKVGRYQPQKIQSSHLKESPLICRVTQVSRLKPRESQTNNSFFLEKVKQLNKEIEVISRYLELIRFSLRQIAEKNQRPTDFACPILSQKCQLWYIPERHESFTSRSAEVKIV